MPTKSSIQESKSAAIDIMVNSYTPHLNSTPQSYQAASYLADASDRFVRPYYEIMDRLSDVSVWQTTELPTVIDTCQQHSNALANASQNINSVIDDQMTAIDSLHANARWLDGYYPDYLGFRASEQLDLPVLKNFDTLIDLAATPAKSIEDVIKEFLAQKDDATEIRESLGTGVSKRQSWMLDYMSQYDSIRFNFENSLSYVIAAIKQLDLLHATPLFSRRLASQRIMGERWCTGTRWMWLQ